MHKGQAIALQLLQDKALATKEAGADALIEADTDLRAMGGAEEGILLADQRAADLSQLDRHHSARIGRGKTDLGRALAGVAEVGHKQRLAGQQALAGAPQLAQHATFGAIAQARLEADAVAHIVHHPSLGDYRFARIEGDFHRLGRAAENLIIELMSGHAELLALGNGLRTAPRILSGIRTRGETSEG